MPRIAPLTDTDLNTVPLEQLEGCLFYGSNKEILDRIYSHEYSLVETVVLLDRLGAQCFIVNQYPIMELHAKVGVGKKKVARKKRFITNNVTGRIDTVKQPRGGYLPLKSFAVEQYDEMVNLDYKSEGIWPTVSGNVVEKLVGLKLGVRPDWLFSKSLNQAKKRDASLLARTNELIDRVSSSKSHEVSRELVLNVTELQYTENLVWADSPFTSPSKIGLDSMNRLADNTIKLLKPYGSLHDWNFHITKYNTTVGLGDGDFCTGDTLWDLKVSVKPFTSKHTLQILSYYLLTDLPKITHIGLINPRRGTLLRIAISEIPDETIDSVKKRVLGIGQEERIRALFR